MITLKVKLQTLPLFGTAFNEGIVHDIDIGSEMNPPALKKPGHPILPVSALDGDYVWDVFYHRPATLSEWIEAANVGTLWVTYLPLPQTYSPHRLFRTGLPPSFGAVYDSASDSEEDEDGEDEDSNGKWIDLFLAFDICNNHLFLV